MSISLPRSYTPEEISELTAPAKGYLCPLDANTYGIQFLEFELKNIETGETIVKVTSKTAQPLPTAEKGSEASVRSVAYNFPVDMLRSTGVRTLLVFSVGPTPVESFRMIERHYFKGELIRSYDFDFGFVIPNSVNSWEAMYQIPEYPEEKIKEFVDSPYGHTSDSYYFVSDKLVMHNKAAYKYV